MLINMNKQRIAQLITMLPEKESIALEIFVKFLISQIEDPVVKMLLMAEEDDKPLTAEETEEIEVNRNSYLMGEMGIPWEEARKELTIE